MTVATGRDTKRWNQVLDGIAHLPPFSPILTRVLAALAREDVSVAELADWVEKDTVLAGQMLRMVNSAAYGRSSTIVSVRHAIAVLGLLRVRNIVLGMSVSRMWNRVPMPRGWSMGQFNLHAFASATLVDLVATKLPVDGCESAFASALLRHIGLLLVLMKEPNTIVEAQELAGSNLNRFFDKERELLTFSHLELTSAVLDRWRLPDSVREGAAWEPGQNGQFEALGTMVSVADEAAVVCGYPLMPNQESSGGDALALLEPLGLSASDTHRMLDAFKRELQALSGVF